MSESNLVHPEEERIVANQSLFKKFTNEQIEKWSGELQIIIKNSIENETDGIIKYVAQLKKLNPNLSNDELVKKIVKRRSLKAAGVGAATGFGGIFTAFFTMPVNLVQCFKIQSRMVLSIAHIYGWDIKDDDNITDVILVLGGNISSEALKKVGVSLGKEVAKKAVNKYINREVMKKINKVVSRKIITKAGEKSLTSFTKLIPLVGAPIGATIDGFSTKAIGETAIKFYSE